MKAGLMLRLARLELRHKEEDQVVRRRTIRIPWGGRAELPQDLPDSGMLRIVVLPEKAPSVEAWSAKVRQHWPQEER